MKGTIDPMKRLHHRITWATCQLLWLGCLAHAAVSATVVAQSTVTAQESAPVPVQSRVAAEPRLGVTGDTPIVRQDFDAADSLAELVDDRPDAQQCLQQLAWAPQSFTVACEPTPGQDPDAVIRFRSPVGTGSDQNDEVVMEWYAARRLTAGTRGARRGPRVGVWHEGGSAVRTKPSERHVAHILDSSAPLRIASHRARDKGPCEILGGLAARDCGRTLSP